MFQWYKNWRSKFEYKLINQATGNVIIDGWLVKRPYHDTVYVYFWENGFGKRKVTGNHEYDMKDHPIVVNYLAGKPLESLEELQHKHG